ncbi:glycosyltransferase family 2 protein [Arthrobacter sp. Sa2CUA1]|uniref:Glycosyltransferase family 2 protein n=1 Tax=Arthrobacter gallicola TaxID=2762225 RepID=A0ABR8UU97_9MICC|nr:glycosyltransferase family 2 protein [Arthrobacter gallicola]MBD7996125.1 glycosyltransferase family 2 protein [Arthrobacter gallicola]
MVAHDGAEYLPETLSALAAQTRPADVCVGVDAGSTDASASLLQLGLPVGSPVTGAPARAGFGAAVNVGLSQLPPRKDADPAQEWLWLLHDDSAPDPDALAQLLRAVEVAPSVTIAGAKQVEWDNPRKLVDVGVSVSRWAERLTMIDADELDQGQYDSRSDVFAVNSAGMLIRRDVWERLGGFDPALPGTGDDIDLCWRNRLAGNRVVVVPAARIRHAGNRPNTAASAGAARKAEIFLRLKHAPGWQIPFLAAGAVLGGLGRFFLGMLAKDPGYAAGALAASIAGILRPVDLYRSRKAAAATRRLPRSTVRALVTGPREVREYRRSVHESEAAAKAHPADHPGAADSYVPSGDANDDFAALSGPARSWVGTGALTAVVLLAVVSLTGLHRLIGAPALTGGALLPVSGALGDIWANASGWWAETGAGYPGHGDPFDYVLWLLGAAGFGNANTAVVVLLVLAMPLAGLSAWFAAGAVTRRSSLRFWAAMFWGALPALQTALGEGRLGALLAHILLPLTALAMARALGLGQAEDETRTHREPGAQQRKPGVHGTPSWTAAAAAGLLLAVLTASAPLLFVLGILSVLVLSLRLRSRARTLWWSLLPSASLLLPVILSASNNLRAAAADPGVPLGFEPAALWQQLLGYPAAFAAADPVAGLDFLPAGPWTLVLALLVGAPVVAVSAAALFTSRHSGAARLAWLLSISALLLGGASAYLATGSSATALVTPFPGPLVSAAVFGQLCSALLAMDALLTRQLTAERTRRKPVTAVVVIVGILLGAGPALSLAAWAIPQAAGAASEAGTGGAQPGTRLAIRSTDPRVLPATAADRGNSPDQTRTLVLTTGPGDDVTATLMRSGGSTLDGLNASYTARAVQGEPVRESIVPDDEATAGLRSAVAVITAGTGVDPRPELARLGVAFVVLQTSDTAAELLADRMDSVPGLTAVGQTDSGWLWRVAGTLDEQGTETVAGQTSRIRIQDAAGQTIMLVPSPEQAVNTEIPAGEEGRKLVLAERADTGWEASLNGTRLEPATEGWAQAFSLPAKGGTLSVSYRSVWQPYVEILQVIVFGLTLLLAVPTPVRSGVIRLPGKQRPARTGSGTPDPGTGTPDPGTPGPGTGPDDGPEPDGTPPSAPGGARQPAGTPRRGVGRRMKQERAARDAGSNQAAGKPRTARTRKKAGTSAEAKAQAKAAKVRSREKTDDGGTTAAKSSHEGVR